MLLKLVMQSFLEFFLFSFILFFCCCFACFEKRKKAFCESVFTSDVGFLWQPLPFFFLNQDHDKVMVAVGWCLSSCGVHGVLWSERSVNEAAFEQLWCLIFFALETMRTCETEILHTHIWITWEAPPKRVVLRIRGSFVCMFVCMSSFSSLFFVILPHFWAKTTPQLSQSVSVKTAQKKGITKATAPHGSWFDSSDSFTSVFSSFRFVLSVSTCTTLFSFPSPSLPLPLSVFTSPIRLFFFVFMLYAFHLSFRFFKIWNPHMKDKIT